MKPVTTPFDFYIANSQKIKQKLSNTRRLSFWQTCPKKQVHLYQWCYIINCNENDNNGNDKIDHINKIYIDQDVDIETNVQNIVCFCKTLPLCNLSKI